MNKYKIVASDLDGTLLNNSGKVSTENLQAITSLNKIGVQFVPSTGRTFSELPDSLKNNKDIRYIIHSNGAVVLDKETDLRLTSCISNEFVRVIYDKLKEYDVHILYRQDGESYVDSVHQTKECFEYYNLVEGHCDVIDNYAIHLEDFEEKIYSADVVEVVSAFFRNLEDKIECENYFKKFPELRVVEVSKFNLEIVNCDAGKGNALYKLADLLGVSYEETMSLGDSDNDLTITKAAGLGIAVSNACEKLKSLADAIICSNEEHAVEYVLKNYFQK